MPWDTPHLFLRILFILPCFAIATSPADQNNRIVGGQSIYENDGGFEKLRRQWPVYFSKTDSRDDESFIGIQWPTFTGTHSRSYGHGGVWLKKGVILTGARGFWERGAFMMPYGPKEDYWLWTLNVIERIAILKFSARNDVIVHPHFKPDENFSNDIALVVLCNFDERSDLIHDFDGDNTVVPPNVPWRPQVYNPKFVDLPAHDSHLNSRHNPDVSETYHIFGWGKNHEELGDFRVDVFWAEVSLSDKTDCEIDENSDSRFTEGEFHRMFDEKKVLCAGASGTGFCEGDYGGPMLSYNSETETATVVGIMSSYSACQPAKTKSDVYTSVSGYVNWINWVIGQPPTTGRAHSQHHEPGPTCTPKKCSHIFIDNGHLLPECSCPQSYTFLADQTTCVPRSCSNSPFYDTPMHSVLSDDFFLKSFHEENWLILIV